MGTSFRWCGGRPVTPNFRNFVQEVAWKPELARLARDEDRPRSDLLAEAWSTEDIRRDRTPHVAECSKSLVVRRSACAFHTFVLRMPWRGRYQTFDGRRSVCRPRAYQSLQAEHRGHKVSQRKPIVSVRQGARPQAACRSSVDPLPMQRSVRRMARRKRSAIDRSSQRPMQRRSVV